MEIIIAFIIIILLYVKLNEISDQLISVKRRMESLQYTLDDMLHQNPTLSLHTEQKKDKETKPSSVYKPLGLEASKEPKEVFKIETTSKHKRTNKPNFTKKTENHQKSKAFEDFIIGNLLLNISIVAFVLGVGFFLKYSIDHNWIPIGGRILIGIAIAVSMIIAGIKTINNNHKLFSEGLFGGAIAILYISIFAGFALEDFAILSFPVAFGMMVIITIIAGFISIKYDSMATAVFGIIGGFATPFLINSGSENIQALMLYIILLSLGVLYLSITKRWSILNWLAFVLTTIIVFGTIRQSTDLFSFLAISILIIFIIYSIVPFINELREKHITLDATLVMLFGANLLTYLGASTQLFFHYDLNFKYFAIITILIAAYLLLYAYYIKQKGIFTQNLLYILIAQALGLILITPAIIFDGEVLSLIWAVNALVLFTVAQKSEQKTFLWFALLALALSFLRYFGVNMLDAYNLVNEQTYFQDLTKQILTAIIIIGVFFISYRLKFCISLEKIIDKYQIREFIMGGGIFLLFTFLNIEVINWAKVFFPQAQHVSTTILWILFGIAIFVISLNQNISQGKKLGMGLIIIAILKAFFIDLADADALYRIILFIVVGILLFVLAYYYKKRENTE